MFSIMLWSKKHLQMGSIECFLLPILILKGTYAFHQQHFHEAFKLCKIKRGQKNNNSCGKWKLKKMHMHLFLTTISSSTDGA